MVWSKYSLLKYLDPLGYSAIFLVELSDLRGLPQSGVGNYF